ncbi:MAG: sialidase family protein, partial [Thermoguttaceae bacterium]
KSTDGGVSWGGPQNVATINLPPLNVSDASGISDALAKGAPVLATSPTQAQDLYLVYAAKPTTLGDEADIFFIKSTNGGSSWSSPLQLNTDNTTCDQILPWVDVKPNGTIDVAWYDRRNDSADQLWDVYVTRSIDGGNTFMPECQLNDQSFATPSNMWMGEYLGLVADSSYGYAAWSSSINDSAGGDIYFDKFPNSSIVPEPSSFIIILGAAFTQFIVVFFRRCQR